MNKVFEKDSTVALWDDDYYHPIALDLYDRSVRDMIDHLKVDRSSPVLDAGCGPGVHSIRIAQAGYRVRAIDISQTMLDEAARRATAAGVADKIAFSKEDLTQLSFPDHSFGSVFSWGVIIHIPDAAKALSELARIVKPGGRLALYVTNRSAVDYKLETFARTCLRKNLNLAKRDSLGDGISYELNGEQLWLWRFSTKGLVENLSRHGLDLVYRRIGELSEVQRRLTGLPRRVLLRLNNAAYRIKVPAIFSVAHLLVFEKR